MQDSQDVIQVLQTQTLFLGFSEQQFSILSKYVTLGTFDPTEIQHPNVKLVGEDVYIILNGQIQARSLLSTDANASSLIDYKTGEIINLNSLVNTTVPAEIWGVSANTNFLKIDMASLRSSPDYDHIYPILLKNVTHYFSDRLQHIEQVLQLTSTIGTKAIQRSLQEIQQRMLFGAFVIRMIIIFCIYILSLKGLEILQANVGGSTLVSAMMVLFVSFFCLSRHEKNKTASI